MIFTLMQKRRKPLRGDIGLITLLMVLVRAVCCHNDFGPYVPACGLAKHTFNASVKDEQGRGCEQRITTTVCYGGCESYEIGDLNNPNSSVIKLSQCDYGQARQRMAFLTNCDDDIDPKVQLYHYIEAVSCHCRSCLSFDIECMVRLMRRRLLSHSPNAIRQLLKRRQDGRVRKLEPWSGNSLPP